MTSKIPTIYSDKFGSVDTEIINDFEKLTISINGTKFTSSDFDDFAPTDAEIVPPRFTLNHFGELTDCSLLCKIPVIVCKRDKEVTATLVVNMHLDYPTQLNYNTNSHFSLIFENNLIDIGKGQEFEGAFEILKNKLPKDTYLKCCYNCLYSDFSYAGSSIFNSMFCFRNIKEKFLKAKTKSEYMDIFDLHDRPVQEIYLCEDFKRKI